MIWSLPVLGVTLLLPLILLPWEPNTVRPRNLVVLAPTEVRGSLGDTVTLPCHLQPLESETARVTQIRWERLDELGDLSIVAEFHWEWGPSIPEPDHVEFVADRLGGDLLDASLTIRDLRPGDEANYICEIQLSTFQMGRASTWLRVFYAPQVSMALYEDIGPQGRRETRLTCDSRSNPEPTSYNWSTISLGNVTLTLGSPDHFPDCRNRVFGCAGGPGLFLVSETVPSGPPQRP